MRGAWGSSGAGDRVQVRPGTGPRGGRGSNSQALGRFCSLYRTVRRAQNNSSVGYLLVVQPPQNTTKHHSCGEVGAGEGRDQVSGAWLRVMTCALRPASFTPRPEPSSGTLVLLPSPLLIMPRAATAWPPPPHLTLARLPLTPASHTCPPTPHTGPHTGPSHRHSPLPPLPLSPSLLGGLGPPHPLARAQQALPLPPP